MSKLFVSGLVNVETVVPINEFPVVYEPVVFKFFEIKTQVSAVGYNLVKSFNTLGSEVSFASIIGKDLLGLVVKQQLMLDGLSTAYIVEQMETTPQSVVMYDGNGARRVTTDLKDIQEQVYLQQLLEEAIAGSSLAVLTNVNFSRPAIKKAQKSSIPIACDLQIVQSLEDQYNQEFMSAADILAMSHEKLPDSPKDFARKMMSKYGTEIIIIGMGSEGALLSVKSDNFLELIPAVYTRPVVSTGGAGDALFSAFLHFYVKTKDPYFSMKCAVTYASYKIGVAGSSKGYLSEPELLHLLNE